MPGRIAASSGQRYACKCLNIRIEAGAPDTAPPEAIDDPAYSKVYVGDSGIVVSHIQLTLRSRQRIAPAPGANRYSRYTTVICLLCDLPVYRIFQVVPADVDGKDGPIIPAEDWVEKETMKSVNGWIEVNNSSLTGDAIIHAEANSSYSSLLSVVVPPAAPQLATLPEKANGTSEEESPTAEPPTYLSHLKPLFPPPPFTPSHPAFMHLASIAEKQSQERRESAEKYIAEVLQQKTEGINEADAALRKEVDTVWKKFRDSWRQAHNDGHAHHHHHHPHHTPLSPRAPTSRRSNSRSRERDTSRTPFARNSSPSYGTPIAIRDFVPTSVIERRASSPPPLQSALSASLAVTTFHHPRARAQGSSPPDQDRRGSPESDSSKTLSTRSGSVTLVQPAVSESINVLQFRRNFDDTINTNATYRYFMIEEEMAKERERRQQVAKPDAETSANGQGSETSAQTTAPLPNANGKEQHNGQPSADKPETQDDHSSKPQEPPTPSRGRDPKGKRKVTFDVEPDVVTIKAEDSEVSTQASATDLQDATRDMIFELEDMEGDKTSSPRPAQALPLLEQPAISRPNRPANGKVKMKGLPESFASLRPSSLPNPSQIRRPIRSPPGVDSSHSMMLSLPQGATSPLRRGPRVNGEKSPPSEGSGSNSAGEPSHRLVAPAPFESHQGAWSADGRAWHTYTRGHPIASSIILEEQETDESESQGDAHPTTDTSSTTPTGPGPEDKKPQESKRKAFERVLNDEIEESSPYVAHGAPAAGVPGSLPVHIHLRKPREPLSLASYQPQHAMPTPEEELVPTKANGKPKSSNAIRRAMYAERDRSRSVDPGLTDLLEDEEEESEVDNVEENAKIDALLSTTRGRRRALKILQTANQLPEAGMWRSLAS